MFIRLICEQGLRRNQNLAIFLEVQLESGPLTSELLPAEEGE